MTFSDKYVFYNFFKGYNFYFVLHEVDINISVINVRQTGYSFPFSHPS